MRYVKRKCKYCKKYNTIIIEKVDVNQYVIELECYCIDCDKHFNAKHIKDNIYYTTENVFEVVS